MADLGEILSNLELDKLLIPDDIVIVKPLKMSSSGFDYNLNEKKV